MQWTLVVEFSEESPPHSTFQHFLPGNETIKTPATDKASITRMTLPRSHRGAQSQGSPGVQGVLGAF